MALALCGEAAADAPVLEALQRMAAGGASGSRAAFLEPVDPEGRGASQRLADLLVSRPDRAVTEVGVEALGSDAAGWLHVLVTARVAPARPPATDGAWLRSDPTLLALPLRARAAPRGIVVEPAMPAVTTGVGSTLVVDPAGRRLEARTRLDLDGGAAEIRVLVLTLPRGAEVRAGPGIASARGFAGEGLDVLRVELGAPVSGRAQVELEHRLDLDASLADGTDVYLPAPPFALPWAQGAPFRADLTIDVPEPWRAVTAGEREELPAAEGRHRARYRCDRDVDTLAIGIARYRVETHGGLELWRSRDVGGAAGPILAELGELVAFQSERVGALPWSTFRLAELPTTQGLAMSTPSVMFMTADVLSTARQRHEILSHEVAHQWWGNLVQGDSRTRWISEGMAEALRDLFVRHRDGEDGFALRLREHRAAALAAHESGVRPLADEPGAGGHVYDRGALFVHALRDQLGEETFFRVLQAWYREFSGRSVGTDALQAVAERTAGGGLGAIFDPWLRTTAFPVPDLEWAMTAVGDGVRLEGRVLQEEPAFPLRLPVRLVLEGGGTHGVDLEVAGPATPFALDAPGRVVAVVVDPERATPAIGPDERTAYHVAEARACLARGLADRAVTLLGGEHERRNLGEQGRLLLAAALGAAGRHAEADALRREVLASLEDPASRARASLDAASRLLEEGAAAAALPLLEGLDREVPDGATVPLQLALALRQLGREQEAAAALVRALERRPCHAAALAMAGRPACPDPPPVGAVAVLPTAQWSTSADAAPQVRAAAAGETVAVLQPGARRLLSGRAGELRAVAGYSPAGSRDVALLRRREGLVAAVLSASSRRSRVDVVALPDGPVVASHERLPGDAVAITADGGRLAIALAGPDGSWSWWRLGPAVDAPSTRGPDDEDGLRRLDPEADDRLEAAGEAGRGGVLLADGVRVWPDGSRLLDSTGRTWALAEDVREAEILSLRRDDGRVLALLRGNASVSPLPEDALPVTWLVEAAPEGPRGRHAMPADAAWAGPGPGASVLVVRAPEGGPVALDLIALLPRDGSAR